MRPVLRRHQPPQQTQRQLHENPALPARRHLMPLPLPSPDIAELAEYLATHLLLEMERGEYTGDDMRSSPEVGCLEQVAAELHRNGRDLPRSIREVLAKAEEAGRVMHP